MSKEISNTIHLDIDISATSINKENTNIRDILKTILIFIIGLPFIVTDLYYAYSSDSCLAYTIPNLPTLQTWLFINGWVSMIGVVITMIVLACFLQLNIGINNDNVTIICMKIIFSLVSLIWMIVGSVIFWKYLEPVHICSRSLSIYMWIRLIFGFISVSTNCLIIPK
jgi:hypothetical protein